MIRASFAGFLADEKGLKELFGIKGQAGNLPYCCFMFSSFQKPMGGDPTWLWPSIFLGP